MLTLIDKKQIRNPNLLDGMIGSGVNLYHSGNLNVESGVAAATVVGGEGKFIDITVSGSINSSFLSGLVGIPCVGSGITSFPSTVDTTGNSLHYYCEYGSLNPFTQVLSGNSIDIPNDWQQFNGLTWSAYPPLGIPYAEQGISLVQHMYKAAAFNSDTVYEARVYPIYAGNITGNCFASTRFVPGVRGFEVVMPGSLSLLSNNLDGRYVFKTSQNTISGTAVSGSPIFVEAGDTFPTTQLATGRLFWHNSSNVLYAFQTGVGVTGWSPMSSLVSSVSGISGIVTSPASGNVVISPTFGTGALQIPSGSDWRFFSWYHQSGSPDPLNISGLSGVAITGQKVNIYNLDTYVASRPNLSFSGSGVVARLDAVNDRVIVEIPADATLSGNNTFWGENHFSGKVGFGEPSPLNRVVIAAGTTTSAPLQILSSANSVVRSSPSDGCFEYDGTGLYFTMGGVRKKFSFVVGV